MIQRSVPIKVASSRVLERAGIPAKRAEPWQWTHWRSSTVFTEAKEPSESASAPGVEFPAQPAKRSAQAVEQKVMTGKSRMFSMGFFMKLRDETLLGKATIDGIGFCLTGNPDAGTQFISVSILREWV